MQPRVLDRRPPGQRVPFASAIPPAVVELVGKAEVRMHEADARIMKTVIAVIEPLGPEGEGFSRAVARWAIDEFAPATYFATARITSRTGKPMLTVAPRMGNETIISGR